MAAFAKELAAGIKRESKVVRVWITDAGGRRSERRVHDVVYRRLGYVA
jgi:hypothetical protein